MLLAVKTQVTRVTNSKIKIALCRQRPIAVRVEEEGNAIKYKPNSSKRILVTIPMFESHILVLGSVEAPKNCTLGKRN